MMVNTALKELLNFLIMYLPLSVFSQNALSQYAAKLSISYRENGCYFTGYTDYDQ